MKNFARRLSMSLRSALERRMGRMRKRALWAELSSSFQRLETRRVLSVDGQFDPVLGILSVDINNQPGNNIAVLRDLPGDSNQFFLDEDNNGTRQGNEDFGLKTALRRIEVNSTVGGAFLWQDNFTNSPVDRILVQNVDDVRLNAQATIAQNGNLNSLINANNLVEFGNNLRFERDLTVNVTNAGGSITNLDNANLTVVGLADFDANAIDLGTSVNDVLNFGTLHFRSNGDVLIRENSSMSIVDVGVETNTANTLELSALGNVEIANGADLEIQGQTVLSAQGTNADITVNGTSSTVNGNVTFRADDSVFFGSTGSVAVGNNNLILVEANFDNANGNSDDGIFMQEGASISAATGRVNMTALGADGGSITISSVMAGSNASNALLISSNGSIVDGSIAAIESANLTTNGTLVLTSNNGAIGLSGLGDIDINAVQLVFNATSVLNGSVHITDLSGGLIVSGISSAQLGGALAALSPLTISANVTVGASFTFTAGNNIAANNDHLTINNNAIVSMMSAVSQVLRFEAGDDILFDTGRIETTLGISNQVELAADLDMDAFQGAIVQSVAAAATIEVTSDSLQANATNGIDLDTSVTNVSASNITIGDVVIDEQNGINLDSIVNAAGSILVTAAGLMNAIVVTAMTDNDLFDIFLWSTGGDVAVGSVLAGPIDSDVTIRAFANVVDGDAGLDNLDVRGHEVTLTADNGSIGSVDSNIFTATPDPIEVSASGTYTANAVNGMVALDIASVGAVTLNTSTAWIQSASDINVVAIPAAILDLRNLALVADVENDGVGNLNLVGPIGVRGDLRLQGADITTTDPTGVIQATSSRMMVVSDASEALRVNAYSDPMPALDAAQLQLDVTSGGTMTVDANFATVPAAKPLWLVDLDGDGIAAQTVDVMNGVINRDMRIRAAGDLLVINTVNSLGHLTLSAADDILVNANVTSGNTAYVLAENAIVNGAPNDGVIMAPSTRIVTNNANVFVVARNDSDILLGLISTGTGSVGLQAFRSIQDNNTVRALTANANAAQNQVTIASVAGLQVGDAISISDDDSQTETFT
ncbi:MAG: hypothetical protein ABL921_28895, partial [Pirellula sp.]